MNAPIPNPKLRAEYWKLPDIISEAIIPDQTKLADAMEDKVKSIQYYYSKPLTEKQFMFIQKDEKLLEDTENFVNVLLTYVQYLLDEHETLNKMLDAEIQRRNRAENDYLDLMGKYIACKTKYDPL